MPLQIHVPHKTSSMPTESIQYCIYIWRWWKCFLLGSTKCSMSKWWLYLSCFYLNHNSAGKRLRYMNNCYHLHGKSKTVYNGFTPWNSDGRGNAVYLNRNNIQCIRGYGLTQFRLVRRLLPSRYQYEFKCTKVNIHWYSWCPLKQAMQNEIRKISEKFLKS